MNKRILVVDDDVDDQEFICNAIDCLMMNYVCTLASNGSEAMKCIAKPPAYDIVMLDLNMPLLNGLETLKIIKSIEDYKNVPVVIVSTSNNQKDKDICKCLGASYYLIKPNSVSELIIQLRNVLPA